jgi:hypothetical protein
MKLLNFEDFLNENLYSLNESLKKGDSFLIGDFTSILLGSTKELKNRIENIEDLSIPRLIKDKKDQIREIRLNSELFSEILKTYKKEHPETKFIFLFMGTDDLYEVNSEIVKYSRKIREEMIRIFPNAQRFIVSAGTWGWGELNIYGDGSSMPSEVSEYYNSIWKPLGFILLKNHLEIQYDEEGNPIEPNLQNPEIRNLSQEILRISEGKMEFYSEDIKSIRDLDSIGMDEEGKLINFYDVLQSAVHDGVSVTSVVQENLKVFEGFGSNFNPSVERAQIGLNFLGYPLSKFGVDGIYTPDVQKSVSQYKSDYEVEGDPDAMDDYFFISLMNNLKNKGFGGEDINNILDQSYSAIDSLETEEGTVRPSYSFSGDLGGDEYLIFVQHNQGVAGASSLVAAKEGKGKIHPFTRSKGMINNIPSDMPDYKSQIVEALNSGNDQRAASLFLEMWKIKYASKKEQGLKNIERPENSQVKAILQQVSSTSGVPFEVLVAIGNIESGLNPKAGNSTYKGLFALNPSTAVKYNPALNYSNVFDPLINAEAGSKMLAAGKDYLTKDLSRKGLGSNLDFA